MQGYNSKGMAGKHDALSVFLSPSHPAPLLHLQAPSLHTVRQALASRSPCRARTTRLSCAASSPAPSTTCLKRSLLFVSGEKVLNGPFSARYVGTVDTAVALLPGKPASVLNIHFLALLLVFAEDKFQYMVRASYIEIYNEEIRDLVRTPMRGWVQV